MTSPVILMLSALLCADPAALDSDYSRLCQARDAAVWTALEQLAADLPSRLLSEDESATAWALLVAFFARCYRDGEALIARLPVPVGGIWLDWRYRGQHALGEGPRFHNHRFCVKTSAGEVAVRFTLARAQAPGAERGMLVPMAEHVQFDEARMTVTLPFAYRQPTGDERARWGRGQAAQRAALQEMLPLCTEAFAGPPLPLQELLKHARAFANMQWADRFLPVGLGPLLESRLEGFLLECAGPSLEEQLSDVEVLEAWRRIRQGVRSCAGPLIEALARTVEPERRLFEKRPFVVRTEWLVPIKHVARSLWPAVLANEAQLEAWRTLFDLPGRIDERTLELHPTLVIDTRHFPDGAFKEALLASFPDRDAALDGILIRAENYRALRFLEPHYRGRVRCIVIDPPYNTGNADYPYRDSFGHSSWLTMMEERLGLAWQLLDDDGALFVHIDDHEVAHLGCLLDELCGEERRVAIVVWHRTYGGNSGAKHLATVHEYILVYARNPARFYAGVDGPFAPDGRELLTSSLLWDYREVGSTATGTKELQTMLHYAESGGIFPTVKPTPLIRRMLRLATCATDRSAILDFFAGSGSLAKAVIDQNRADGGDRRFLLVEQSRHFELTILPRVMRAMYCPTWKDARPVGYPEPGLWWPQWVERTPRLVQVLHLERYEDSLENLSIGESSPASGPGSQGHAIRYRVPLPLGSQADLLEGEQFARPFTSSLTLLSERGACPAAVDLVETFNALLGLHVESTRSLVNPDTGRQYQAVSGRLGERRVLVLWSEGPGGTAAYERPFLLERVASFDLVLTNDPDGLEGMESLVSLFRERMEERTWAGPE